MSKTAQILVSLSNLSPRSTRSARVEPLEKRELVSNSKSDGQGADILHLRLLERVPEIAASDNRQMNDNFRIFLRQKKMMARVTYYRMEKILNGILDNGSADDDSFRKVKWINKQKFCIIQCS